MHKTHASKKDRDVEHIKNYFNKRAKIYDEAIEHGFIVSAVRKQEDTAFLTLLGRCNGDVILDAGCGTGHHIRYLLERGAKHIVGMDVSSRMLEIARKKFREHGNVKFYQSDILKFEYPKKFDKIISIGVLDHMKDPFPYLAFFHRHLKKNGILIISFPNKSFFGKIYTALSGARGIKIWNVSQEEAKNLLKNAKFGAKKIVPTGFKNKIFDGLTLMCKATKANSEILRGEQKRRKEM